MQFSNAFSSFVCNVHQTVCGRAVLRLCPVSSLSFCGTKPGNTRMIGAFVQKVKIQIFKNVLSDLKPMYSPLGENLTNPE